MKIKFLITALILFIFFGTYEVQARCWQGCGYGVGCMRTYDCLSGASLSLEQTNKFNSLRVEFLQETTAINIKLLEKELGLQTLLLGSALDPEKAADLQKALSKLQTEYDAKMLSYQLKARNILTSDQAAKLPPGCSFGFGNMVNGQGRGYGYGYGGPDARRGRGRGCGCW